MDRSRINSESLKSDSWANLSTSDVMARRDSQLEKTYSSLAAIRTSALDSVPPVPPTWKTYYGVFRILRSTISLGLSVECFNLLTELDKRYPRVYLNYSFSLGTDSSGGGELMVNKKMWSPFIVESNNFHDEATTLCSDRELLIDSKYFSFFVENIALGRYSTTFKMVQKMLLFQYLVRALEDDYLFHQTSYNRTLNYNILRESVISMLLASRKMNYRNLVHNCMSIASKSFFLETNVSHEYLKGTESTSVDFSQSCSVGLSYAFPDFRKSTCVAAQKFLIMILELDLILKETENCGFTSRATILETIIDVLTYNQNQIFPFLEVFGEPKWKLEIILLYLGKYCKKGFHKIKKEYPDDLTLPTTDTWKTNDSPCDGTLQSILNFFSNPIISCGILREVTFVVTRFLLAQAFKCYLSLQPDPKNAIFLTRMIGERTLLEVCELLISAFLCISKLDGNNFAFTCFELEAVYMAFSIHRRITHAEAHYVSGGKRKEKEGEEKERGREGVREEKVGGACDIENHQAMSQKLY